MRRLSRRRSSGRISRGLRRLRKPYKIDPALVGRAGELLVATELMRRGIDVAYPESDYGIDIIAFRRNHVGTRSNKFVPIQVKTRSESGYSFQKDWFNRATELVLVQVWRIFEDPEFYIFQDLRQVEDALGDHALSPS